MLLLCSSVIEAVRVYYAKLAKSQNIHTYELRNRWTLTAVGKRAPRFVRHARMPVEFGLLFARSGDSNGDETQQFETIITTNLDVNWIKLIFNRLALS